MNANNTLIASNLIDSILHSCADLQNLREIPLVWTQERIDVLKSVDNNLDYLLDSLEDTEL